MTNEEVKDTRNTKKAYILKNFKLSLNENSPIYREITNYVNSSRIFDMNNSIFEGKLVRYKFCKNPKLCNYSYIGRYREELTKKNTRSNQRKMKNKIDTDNKFYFRNSQNLANDSQLLKLSNNTIDIIHSPNKDNINYYKIINNKQLNVLYTIKGQKIKKNNSINQRYSNIYKNNDVFLPEYITSKLNKQEKLLKRNVIVSKILSKMKEKLAKKIKRANGDSLTYTTKENNIDWNSINEDAKVNWKFNLRNDKINGLYHMNGYFKENNSNEDIFATVSLNNNKHIYVNSLKNSVYDKNDAKMEALKSIKIKGDNLLNYERNNEMLIKGKKKLINYYKIYEKKFSKPKDNHKITVQEIQKKINELYTDKTFAVNYNKMVHSHSTKINKKKSFSFNM